MGTDRKTPPGLIILKYYKESSALRRTASIEPRSPRIYVALGFACLELEKYRDALQHFEKATMLNVKTSYAVTGLGITYAKLKDYEKAEDAFAPSTLARF